MTVRVRFAPSPTGSLHMGNVRTALINALFCQKEKGAFVLRFEDTDLEREVPHAEENMLQDFAWLGFCIDESVKGGAYGPYRTRERAARGDYQKALDFLFEKGLAYECFVSKEELDMIRKVRTSQGLPPGYDNRHRDLTEAEKEAFRKEGRKPVIRFKLLDGEIMFTDLVRGDVRYEAKNLGGDPVIVRSNGIPTFTFAGAVDDINQSITHVIRGEDHVTNAAAQVRIFEALEAQVPTFAHLPMLLDTDGGKLSKRLDSLSVKQLREEGFLPESLIGYLASLGTNLEPQLADVKNLAQQFDFNQFSRSPSRFDLDQALRLNAQRLRAMPWQEAKPFIIDALPHGLDEAVLEQFWAVARQNIRQFSEVSTFVDLCFGTIENSDFSVEDKPFIEDALTHLPEGVFNGQTWADWVHTLKKETDRKGKKLFMPLRFALTGQTHGPELAELLPLIGRERALERLQSTLN